MIKLNKLVTESISGVNVLVSYDDPSQTFKVISKEKGDLLIEYITYNWRKWNRKK